jgi:cbb3-type cytochrome oxidase maturation protein
MESLYLLIPLSVLIVFAAIGAFLLMSENGQFDDTIGPANRILFDDDLPVTDATSKVSLTATRTEEASPNNLKE